MKKNFKFLTIILLLAGIVATQVFYDKQKSKAAYSEPLVLKAEIVKVVDLGLHNAVADLMWLASIQYFGGGTSKTNEKLDDYLFAATELDPKFSYPYAFGALVLPGLKQTDQAVTLADKGIRDADPDWRIPYYLAATYHIDLKDYKNAAKYFDLAARTAGAPANIQAIAASYGTRPDLRSQTKQIWLGIMETSRDETLIERARLYVAHYELLDFLEFYTGEYQKKNGEYPAKLDDLVAAGILKGIPQDPFGLKLIIDPETGRVSAE
ncbi:MAG: hypothetical protein AAB360_02865 [Patescibacteria group bacterium]